MFPYGSSQWGSQPVQDDPHVRLTNLEVLVQELGNRLNAHIGDSANQVANLRMEVGQSHARGVHIGHNNSHTIEVNQLRSRLAKLEAEFQTTRGGTGATSAASFGGFRGFFTTHGDADSEDSEVVVGDKGRDDLSLFPGLNWASSWWEPEVSEKTTQKPAPGAGWKSVSQGLPAHSHDGAHRELPADAVANLDASIWDCALVIILHQGCDAMKDPRQQWYLGAFNIIQTWTLLFFNIIVQVLFIIAVHSMSTPDPFADLRGTILDTRLMQGQLYSAMDRKSMTTRTEQTCNNQVYDSLTDTIRGITEYLGLEADKGLMALPGNAICFLAMLFWVVEMTVELRRCADLFLVVLALPTFSKTIIEETGTTHVVKGVTKGHKALCICCVLLPRGAISFYLLTFGKRFLAGTMDIGELILNTCALEFVKNVDDMIFEAMATRTLILFTQTAKIFRVAAVSQQPLLDESSLEDFQLAGHIPARVPRMGGWRAEILNVAVALLFVTFQSFEGYTQLIQPFVDSAKSVYADVCERDTRFTYLHHPVTGVPVFASTDESADEMINMRCFWASQYEMVRMRAGFPPQHFPQNSTLAALNNGSHQWCAEAGFGGNSPMACPERDFGKLAQITLMSEKGYYASPDCRDQDVAFVILRKTCLSEVFNTRAARLEFFEDAHSCYGLMDECRRTKRYNLSFGWWEKLSKLCAATCGRCTSSEVVAT